MTSVVDVLEVTELEQSSVEPTTVLTEEQIVEVEKKRKIDADKEETYNYCYKFYDQVSRDGIFKIYDKMREEKKCIDNILGLTLENDYRKTLEVPYSDAEYEKNFGRTYMFVKELANGKTFSISENKIEIGTNKFQKLSRYLSPLVKELSEYDVLDSLIIEGKPEPKHMGLYDACRNELHNPKDLVSNIIEKSMGNKICISTNLRDFFTSSTNSSYSSCYQVGGAYFAGNMSNMIDEWTFITFTYSNDIKYKVGRNWFQLIAEEGKVMHPSRTYGTMFKREQKIIREYVEERFSDVLKVANKWKVKYNDVSLSTSCVYYDGSNTVLAVNSEFMEKNDISKNHPELDFPNPWCVRCGEEHENSTSGLCDDCDDRGCCCCCEGSYDTDDMYCENGDYYCSDCHSEHFSYCDDCEEYYPNDDVTYISKEDKYVCDHCLSRNYTECQDCGNYVDNDNSVTVDGKEYCEECADDKGYSECGHCGDYYWNEDMVEIEGNMYCDDCTSDKGYGECSDCGELFFSKNLETHNEELYCKDCLPEDDSEEKEEENDTEE